MLKRAAGRREDRSRRKRAGVNLPTSCYHVSYTVRSLQRCRRPDGPPRDDGEDLYHAVTIHACNPKKLWARA